MGVIANLKEYATKSSKAEWSHQNYNFKVDFEDLKLNILKEVGQEVYTFLANHVNLAEQNSFITATTTRFNIKNLPSDSYKQIINLKNINDARYVNKFFEAISAKLDLGGIYINNVETYATRRHRVLGKFIKPFNWLYYFADVVFLRIFPKLPLTKKIYFFITKGRNRVLTRAEAFGRLYSCGFEIIDETESRCIVYVDHFSEYYFPRR